MFPTVGDWSPDAVPSASHAAVTPADVTPFHVLLVVVLTFEIRRYGFALALFVRTMVGDLLPAALTSGRAGHFCQPLHVSMQAGLYLHLGEVPRT
jgi:hypothetical protein